MKKQKVKTTAGAKAPAKALRVAVPADLRSKAGKPDGARYGRTTGLRMTHFVDALLRANEKAKLPDDVLQAALAAEFPQRQQGDRRGRGIPTVQSVSAYRSYFNGAKHGHNPGGKFSSRRYG